MLASVHLLLDFGLVVLIWLVQLVVYPGFRHLPPEALARWHGPYTARITWIVAPLMIGQLVALGLALQVDPAPWAWASAGLVGVAWATTFLASVPAHARLSAGREPQAAIDSLVRSNWWRTAAWSAVFLIDAGAYGLRILRA